MASERASVPREEQSGLVTFALPTFNVTLALLVVLLLLYRRDPELGERLGDLGTGAGLGLFALVWIAAVWATRGAFRGVRLLAMPLDLALLRGMTWGGRAGVLVHLVLEGVVVVSALARIGDASTSDVATEGPLLLLYLAAVAAIGSAAAFVVGAAVGVVAAVVDYAALLLVRIAPESGADG
jgi:hypothetical protein